MARTKRYAERVNVLKKVRVNGSWKLASVLERNGKIVRDHVLISGNDEHHPEGAYYLEWYQEGKRRRQAVGDFSEVVEAARRKSIEVNAQKAGIIEASQGPEQHRVTIGQAIDKYLDFIKAHRKQRTYVTYRYTLVLLCYKKGVPQKGQLESCRSRTRAIVCRRVAIDHGLCRSTRTG